MSFKLVHLMWINSISSQSSKLLSHLVTSSSIHLY